MKAFERRDSKSPSPQASDKICSAEFCLDFSLKKEWFFQCFRRLGFYKDVLTQVKSAVLRRHEKVAKAFERRDFYRPQVPKSPSLRQNFLIFSDVLFAKTIFPQSLFGKKNLLNFFLM